MDRRFSPETEYFLYLIRCAVKGEVVEKPAEPIDWKILINLAKKQEVYSVIASVLPKEFLPDEQATRLHNYSKSELARLIAMKSELALLEEELGENGIDFMLLKGARIREFYPKESMRQMSDIDILYDENARDKLLRIMKNYGYTLYSWSENSDDFSKKPYYTFEFHRQLFFKDFENLADFSFVWDNAKRDEDNHHKCIMSDEDLYIHSTAHMYKHHVLGGFGLRFLLDTYLILTKAQNLDFDYINSKLESMKLADFEKQIRELSFAVIDKKELTKEQVEFVTNVFSFGLYGDSGKGREVQFEQFKAAHGGSSSMVKYTLSRLFPPSEYMHRTYRVLDKAPFLLPYFYVQRLVTKTITDGGKAAREIKDINEVKKKDN
ncbi:MAG: nucleotidyltransferase family protein [Eubacterium sp.]|nr:nucleotidyltransferase family protein [Eubacterium sp.]